MKSYSYSPVNCTGSHLRAERREKRDRDRERQTDRQRDRDSETETERQRGEVGRQGGGGTIPG